MANFILELSASRNMTGEVRNLTHLSCYFKLKMVIMQMKLNNLIKGLLIVDVVLTVILIVAQLF